VIDSPDKRVAVERLLHQAQQNTALVEHTTYARQAIGTIPKQREVFINVQFGAGR
jgi:hypothetical protein